MNIRNENPLRTVAITKHCTSLGSTNKGEELIDDVSDKNLDSDGEH